LALAKERYRRKGDTLDRNDIVAVRGGALDAAMLREGRTTEPPDLKRP
jgi:hypothetical protein